MDKVCKCGKIHKSTVKELIIESGALKRLPEYIKNAKKIFVLSDVNTHKAAGEKVIEILKNENKAYCGYIYQNKHLEPDESAVGSAFMHCPDDCDLLIGAGSGVINDVSKILSNTKKITYIIVATAPSMDGYASNSSSMIMDNFKISLSSKCPDIIIADTDILKNAPEKMLKSGLGDMLAKYVSICEWKISHLINGEYYCDEVAQLVKNALKKCVDNAPLLLKRDEKAIEAVFEGLALSGTAMEYAGISRPASGTEHYISHIWDMRALSFGTNADLHGIQCAIGTFTAAKIYDQIRTYTPDREKALRYAESFDFPDWCKKLEEFVGDGAGIMIEKEKTEQKYNVPKHKIRLQKIIENWDGIIKIINEEMPGAKEIENILDELHMPKTAGEIGIDNSLVPMTFKATRDVRYKYILSHLCWDLGITDDIKF